MSMKENSENIVAKRMAGDNAPAIYPAASSIFSMKIP